MKRYTLVVAVAVWLSCLTFAPAWAVDIEPPDYRGEPNSLVAEFDLQGSSSFMSLTEAPGATFPLSTVPPEITPDFSSTPILYQVRLPNYIDDLPLKKMRLQYSWFGQGDATLVTVNAVPQTQDIAIVDSIPATAVPGPTNLFYRWDDVEIRPNPDFESFQFEIIGDPYWLVVDTISTVPEPSSAALLVGVAMAGIALRRRHR